MRFVVLLLLLAGFIFFFYGRSIRFPEEEKNYDENRVFGEISDSEIQQEGKINIEGIGEFTFSPGEVETVRKDLFKEGFFSVFDILVSLDGSGVIDMTYRFDESMNTHVIESMNGRENWWYRAHYDGGWPEGNAFRMDHFPYKDKMVIVVFEDDQDNLGNIYQAFREEIERKNKNDGKIIVPEVIIRGRGNKMVFNDLEIKAYNLRNDMLKEGTITALDVILTLGEDNKLTYDLQWRDSIGSIMLSSGMFISKAAAAAAAAL